MLLAALVLGGLCPVAMQFDQPISLYLRQFKLPGDLQKAISLSEAFAHGLGVTCILLAVFVIAVDRRRVVAIAILITALSGTTANVLKAAVVRVRPHAEGLQVKGHNGSDSESEQAVDRSYWDARQRSFPSGHAATAWGLAIGLSLVFGRGWWIFGMLAALASVQRIESGAHYPSDVLAGMAIAFIIAACIVALPRIRRLLQFDVC
jgi:membrane-associated phospholipid phosphatase